MHQSSVDKVKQWFLACRLSYGPHARAQWRATASTQNHDRRPEHRQGTGFRPYDDYNMKRRSANALSCNEYSSAPYAGDFKSGREIL